MSGYLIYSCHQRELGQGRKGRCAKPSITEFTKQVAAKWNCLSKKNKEPFQKRATHDKARYEHEKAYYAKMGVACTDGAAMSKKRAQKKKNKKCA